jgi:hypothetical protein
MEYSVNLVEEGRSFKEMTETAKWSFSVLTQYNRRA